MKFNMTGLGPRLRSCDPPDPAVDLNRRGRPYYRRDPLRPRRGLARGRGAAPIDILRRAGADDGAVSFFKICRSSSIALDWAGRWESSAIDAAPPPATYPMTWNARAKFHVTALRLRVWNFTRFNLYVNFAIKGIPSIVPDVRHWTRMLPAVLV